MNFNFFHFGHEEMHKKKSVYRRQQFSLIKGSLKGICDKLKPSCKAASESHLTLRLILISSL